MEQARKNGNRDAVFMQSGGLPVSGQGPGVDPTWHDRLDAIRGARVLLVEDDETNQFVGAQLLEMLGMCAEVAPHGRAALEATASKHYDLVLMDIQMPGMDGTEATRQLRARETAGRDVCDSRPGATKGGGGARGRLPIIAMTAQSMRGDRERFIEAGMDDYITKPVDQARLLELLVKWIAPRKQAGPGERRAGSVPGTVPSACPAGDLPGLSPSTGLARLSGNVEMYRTLLGGFRERYEGGVREMQAGLQHGRHDQVVRVVHALHSVAGNLGALELAEAARVVEHKLRSGEREAGMEVALVMSHFATVCDSIDLFLKGGPRMPAPAPGASPAAGQADVAGLIADVLEALDEDVAEAQGRMAQVDQSCLTPEQARLAGRAAGHLALFEIEETRTLLGALHALLTKPAE